jgi:hypothetical protein
MNFEKLHDLIPYATGGKNHAVTMAPYNAVTLAMPGRHQHDTVPAGGDFVVMVSDDNLGWVNHQFTHDDIFLDMEKKHQLDSESAERLMADYAAVVFGADPEKYSWERGDWESTLHPQTFLYAVQCLAVAEHRRYHQFEKRGGGRYLPMRFTFGIVSEAWTAADCKNFQRRGRPGLEHLEKEKDFRTNLTAIKQFIDAAAA